MKKKYWLAGSLAALVILLGIYLILRPCRHQWQEATCMAPRTCSRCGETEGKVRAHKYASTDCNAPEPCVYCGTLDGIEYTHHWRSDTKICKYCRFDGRPADERFIDKLVAGLEARFALYPPEPTPEDDEYWYGPKPLTQEDWKARFEAEFQQVSPFLDEEFEDPELGKLAKTYVSCIYESMDALSTFGTEEWDELYSSHIYQVQTETLFHIHKMHPLAIKAEHYTHLREMLTNGEAMMMVNELMGEAMFLYLDTSYGTKKYETTLTNNTSLDFRYFILEIEMLDTDGNRVDTESITKHYWDSGETVRFTVRTDAEFDVMRIYSATWRLRD